MAILPTMGEKVAYEGNSALVEVPIKDYQGVLIPKANISSATITLRDKLSGDWINGRGPTPVDVMVSISDTGTLSFNLLPADNIIVSTDPLVEKEVHALTLVVVANNGVLDITIDREIWITVMNEKFKPLS